jgi:hypothetical protein
MYPDFELESSTFGMATNFRSILGLSCESHQSEKSFDRRTQAKAEEPSTSIFNPLSVANSNTSVI